jgi:hypothetical protein
MITTATVHAAATLHARVEILAERGTKLDVRVITGVGGWSKPGKTFTTDRAIVSDVRTELPTPATKPAAPMVPIEAPAVELVEESAELAEGRAELARLERLAVANFTTYAGTSRMRGKQNKLRGDAQLKRGADYQRHIQVAKIRVDVLERAAARVSPAQ